jgi:ADP-L-glycero-D-manno-heptose 6-epimerase
MIVVTGAAGFIGSCLVRKLNNEGHRNLILVDKFNRSDRARNLHNKGFIAELDRAELFEWLDRFGDAVTFVYHIGARTDTAEQSKEVFDELNLDYSKKLWSFCSKKEIPFMYASSAATYGLGEKGYVDAHDVVKDLKPLNPYGDSKNEFDKWLLEQDHSATNWAGFKFFNVYGPNEFHKGRMASVIFHTFKNIKNTGEMKLFRSHKDGIADGQQMRDFVYVKDLVDVLYFFFKEKRTSGIYNLGTGKARSFYDLAALTFLSMGKEPAISFIDTPADIRDNYQYFTEADMSKLRAAGYESEFSSLEDGVADYVTNHLITNDVW